jgi:hypothetical protein
LIELIVATKAIEAIVAIVAIEAIELIVIVAIEAIERRCEYVYSHELRNKIILGYQHIVFIYIDIMRRLLYLSY